MQINQVDLEKAQSAIRWLAGRCDFATSNDGQGFSGTDAVLGHALADKTTWSSREMLTALNLLVKYKKQISNGSQDISGLETVRINLVKDLGLTRVSKREMVEGEIRVLDNNIIIKTNKYNPALVSEVQELVGRKWDGIQNSCSLCAANAVAVEEIANRFGLKLHKHRDWAQLVDIRSVETKDGTVLIHGVNARQIIKSLPARTGEPDIDDKSFAAIVLVDDTKISIPLRSWVIRDAMLWLESLDSSDLNYARLRWAFDELRQRLGESYPKALLEERANFSQSSAVTLPQGSQARIAATLPPEMARRLMPHQWVAIQALLNFDQTFLADQQGLGKTVEVLAFLESAKAYPAIVLAPATALLNWRDEVKSWLAHRNICVLGSSITKRDQGAPLDNADIVVINYESFAKHADAIALRHPKSLVADEVQYLKGYNSARTKAVKDFCRSTGLKRVIAVTGTPVMNRPAELLTLLTLLPDLLTELGGFQRFAARYCRATLHTTSWSSWWDYSGAANLGELANRIRETGRFVRRDKSSVLTDLVAKQYEFQPVAISNRAAYTLASNDFKEWLKTQIKSHGNPKRKSPSVEDGEIEDTSRIQLAAKALGFTDLEISQFQIDRAEGIRRITALRQLVGVGKVSAAVQWIEQNVKDTKLIVFAVHVEVQEALITALTTDLGPPLVISGEMSAKARHEAIARFQNEPLAMVIVCSLKASQTAITLTAARRVLMVELDWTPSALEQAEDRAHRIGQSGEVIVTYLHAPDTLDDRMSDILRQKQAKIGVLTASAAPHGYRKDGTPRLRPAGPGRPPLDPTIRVERRKSSKADWQAKNAEYMRDYMRQRRQKVKVKKAQDDIDYFDLIKDLDLMGMRRFMDDRYLRQSEYESELQIARIKAERGRALLQRSQANVKDQKQP